MSVFKSLNLSLMRLARVNYRDALINLSHRSQLSQGFLANPGPSITTHTTTQFYGTYEGTERQPYPLTREEALAFLQYNLGIGNALEHYRDDPEALLNKISKRMKETVPYSTGYLFSFPLDQMSDVIGKYHIMSGHGGGCGAVNPFTNAILRNIGYKTREINGFNPQLGGDVEFHISTLACDVNFPGSRHLVEAGSKPPLLQAISLDFEGESPSYKFHHKHHKFFKKDDLLFWGTKAPQKVLSSLEDFEMMMDGGGNKWKVVLVYRLEQENARVRYNKFVQKLAKGEQAVSKDLSNFFCNAFLGGKLVTVIGSNEAITVTSVDKNGKTESNNINSNDLKDYFARNFGTLSWKHLLDKIIAADYQFLTHDAGS